MGEERSQGVCYEERRVGRQQILLPDFLLGERDQHQEPFTLFDWPVSQVLFRGLRNLEQVMRAKVFA